MKTIKIKDFKTITTVSDVSYIYALADNGKLYFITHNPEINHAEWRKLPSPEALPKDK